VINKSGSCEESLIHAVSPLPFSPSPPRSSSYLNHTPSPSTLCRGHHADFFLTNTSVVVVESFLKLPPRLLSLPFLFAYVHGIIEIRVFVRSRRGVSEKADFSLLLPPAQRSSPAPPSFLLADSYLTHSLSGEVRSWTDKAFFAKRFVFFLFPYPKTSAFSFLKNITPGPLLGSTYPPPPLCPRLTFSPPPFFLSSLRSGSPLLSVSRFTCPGRHHRYLSFEALPLFLLKFPAKANSFLPQGQCHFFFTLLISLTRYPPETSRSHPFTPSFLPLLLLLFQSFFPRFSHCLVPPTSSKNPKIF